MGYVTSQRRAVLLVLSSLFETLALLVVGLRVWSRKIKHIGLQINDFAILVAAVRKSEPTQLPEYLVFFLVDPFERTDCIIL